MMQTRFLARATGLFLLLFLALPLLAADGRDGSDRLFLWEVKSKTTTVHVLGTIHLAKPEIYPLDSAIEEAFENASVLAVEADVNSLDPMRMQQIVMSKGVYTDGTTLADNISDETHQRLERYFAEHNLTSSLVAPMKPWLAAMTISVMELQRLGYDPAHGIDKHFLDRAAKLGKPVRELESVEFQIDLLAGFPAEVEELYLEYTLEELERLPEMMDSLMASWHSGDTKGLEKLLLEHEAHDERLAPLVSALFFDRNVTMAEKIRDYLKSDESCMVVVGAGHLVGERGVIELLAGDGYSIAQLTARGRAAAQPTTAP